MWRSSFLLLKEGLSSTIIRSKPYTFRRFRSRTVGSVESSYRLCNCLFSSSAGGDGGGVRRGGGDAERDGDSDNISFAEAKKLMRLVNVEALKTKFGTEGKEVIGYSELLEACESLGVAKSVDEAKAFATVLDEAGVVLIFRDKVYLHPDKVVDLVRRAVPLALAPDDDPRREELKNLQSKQEEIDRLAHKQVRRILYSGLGISLAQIGLFFRLTFWEFSWDVMEPIAFFATTSGIIVGYAYFLITSRDPTYQDFMKRLFLSRRKKLMKKHNFDVERFMELQEKCKSPLDAHPSAKHDFAGVELETKDLLHKN
ncbi:hypothetical protein SSX86_022337 [Deinandra increscens subsp. villosa]|uniref:Calcium uniporter protein C-terminal domain-containing protein n=1 Tax=Deinandra increscens subsp. villosa TaxID=3103831 RepID=A0AAP0CK64_9ASTR